jgi:hypothetical protein
VAGASSTLFSVRVPETVIGLNTGVSAGLGAGGVGTLCAGLKVLVTASVAANNGPLKFSDVSTTDMNVSKMNGGRVVLANGSNVAGLRRRGLRKRG